MWLKQNMYVKMKGQLNDYLNGQPFEIANKGTV